MSKKMLFTYGMRLLGAFGAAMFTFVIAKLTSAKFVGEFQLALTLALGLSILMRGGMDRGIVRFVAQADSSAKQQIFLRVGLKKIAMNGLAISCIAILMTYVFWDLSGHAFTLVLAILISISMLFSGYLKGLFMPNLSYVYEMGIVSLLAVFLSAFYFLTTDESVFYYSLILAYLIVLALFGFIFRKKKVKVNTKPIHELEEFKSISRGFMQMTFVVYLQQILIVICLSYYLSTEALGVYKVAERIAFIAGFFQSVVAAIYSPYFSKLYKNNEMSALKAKIISAYKMSLLVSFPFFLAICIGGKTVLSYFGEEYVEGYRILLILTLSQLVNVVLSVGGMLLNQTEFVDISKKIVIVVSIMILPFVAVMAARYGAIGAALSVLFYFLCLNLTLTYFSVTKIKFEG